MFSTPPELQPDRKTHSQCPNCGAPSVSVRKTTQDPATGKLLKPNTGMSSMQGVGILLVSGTLSFLLVRQMFGRSADCLALLMTAIVSIGIITAYSWREARRHFRAITMHYFDCRNCGYTWSWQEGTPVPVVNQARDIQRDYIEVFGHAPARSADAMREE